MRCFSWSRMVVEDTQSLKGCYKNSVLPFEGFMEALCRLSAQKSMPTEEEVEQVQNVGEYLQELKKTDLHAYEQLLIERKLPWCSSVVLDDFPRRVEAVISIFLVAVERFTGAL